MNFSEKLKLCREKEKYSQSQLAELLGIKVSTYSGYENGRSQPNIDKIRKLVSALNTPADVLLETKFAEEASQDSELNTIFGETTKQEMELIATFRRLDSYNQSEVLNFVNYRISQNKNTPPR